MSTGLSPEERLQIINEVLLVVSHSSKVQGADSPKADLFWLLATIHNDSSPHRCTLKQTLFSVLRKSPVWSKVRPFLEYGDSSCARKGCQCREGEHENKTGKCSGYHYQHINSNGPWTKVPCACPGFIQKDFK